MPCLLIRGLRSARNCSSDSRPFLFSPGTLLPGFSASGRFEALHDGDRNKLGTYHAKAASRIEGRHETIRRGDT